MPDPSRILEKNLMEAAERLDLARGLTARCGAARG